jgi:hypothetical protein
MHDQIHQNLQLLRAISLTLADRADLCDAGRPPCAEKDLLHLHTERKACRGDSATRQFRPKLSGG